jgi:transcriptional regulator with XRE-family HTH domain
MTMGKKHINQAPSFRENEPREIENMLRKLATDGELDFPVTEEMLKKYERELSPDSGEKMWERIRARNAVARRFRACHQEHAQQVPFSELLHTLRGKAGVSLEEFARAVQLEASQVTALERGQMNPLKLSAALMATLMEVCGLRLSLVEGSLKRLLAVQGVKNSLSGVAARSSTDVADEDYEKILFDISSHVAEKESGSDKVALPEGYLESLRDVLNLRGRTDLL